MSEISFARFLSKAEGSVLNNFSIELISFSQLLHNIIIKCLRCAQKPLKNPKLRGRSREDTFCYRVGA